jgi:NTP pyrophosphatase (non-canonical NTP hydrolase)
MKHTLKQLTDAALAFRDERDWKQFHNPKDLAIALSLEAAEVLELMQWKAGQELADHIEKKKGDLADELSDVLHAVLLLAADHDIDLGDAFLKKLEKNRKKYPVHKAHGQAKKYTELE